MATAPSKQPANVAQTFTPLPVAGKSGMQVHLPLLPTIPAPAPVTQSSYTVGTDSVAFTVKAQQTITVTFPNLPTRSTAQNPLGLRQVTNDLAVRSFDQLNFTVALQNVSGPAPSISPVTIDTSNVRCPGTFLGGGNTYRTFQATVTGGAQGSSGTIVGTLVYQVQ